MKVVKAGNMGLGVLAALLFAALPIAAMALDLSDHPNVHELQRPDMLPATPKPGFVLPPVRLPPRSQPGAADSAGVVVQQVEFEGNRVLTADELAKVAAPWLGRPIGAADLESLRLELTRHYIERGYLNSGAQLADPPITTAGVARFRIVEGRLAEIRIEGQGDLAADYLKARLTSSPDEVLNVDQLRERFQLLLDDPLFERINAQLAPGERLGEAVLSLETQRALPYQLSLQLNNYRSPSIGEAAVGASGAIRNLTGRGDVLEANMLLPVEGGNAYRAGLIWKTPINYSGTWLSVQADDGDSQVIEEPMRSINIRSRLTTLDLGVQQVMIDRLNHRLSLGLNFAARTNRTFLDGRPFSFAAGEPDGVTRARTAKFWQEYAYRSEQQVLALRSSFAHTSNNHDSIPGAAASAYTTWLGQFQYVRKLTDGGVQLVGRFVTQQSSKRLLSMDAMSIGGIATVRGFRENQMIRDKGQVASLELDIPVIDAESGQGHTLNLIPFVDYGRGRNIGESAETIASRGLALRWRWQALSLDLAWAQRVTKPDSFKTAHDSLQDRGIHLQLAYKVW